VGFNNYFIQNFTSVMIRTDSGVRILIHVYGVEMYEMGLVLIYTRFQPHYSNRDFSPIGVYSVLPKKVSRCSLKVFLPEVYTASFGGDVKPSVPGDLV